MCLFVGLDNIRLHLGGQNLKINLPEMGGNKHFDTKPAKS